MSGTVLVTGATGFVGSALVGQLAAAGWRVFALMHDSPPSKGGDVDGVTWCRASEGVSALPLAECDVVVHLAARVHVMRESAPDPLAEFRLVNVQLTERLARRAAAAGVRRFVFLSTIKVNGEETAQDRPFQAKDLPHPGDAYATSKHEAELALRRVASETGLEMVIIRPPLIYGPGVKGNFATMLNWLRRGVPLPLASLKNRRSLVGLDNLCDLIKTCLTHRAAANETFLVSDGRDLSTTELFRLAGLAIGRRARLFPLPPSLLVVLARMAGKGDVARRLCGSLQVDIGKTKRLLGWEAPFDVESGLRKVFSVKNA